MDIETLRTQHRDLAGRARAIQQAADEANRELTVDEARDFEDYLSQADQLGQRIAREEALTAHENGARTSFRAPTRPGTTETRQTGDPQRYRSFGEQLQVLAEAARPGGRVDPRIIQQRAAIQQRALLGQNESIPGDGGVLVQTDFATELVTRVYETGALANRARRIPLSSNANSIKIPAVNETSRATGSRWGGIQAYWVEEGGTKTASDIEFRQVELHLHKLAALVYVTDELLQDASALESYVRRAVSEELAFRLDHAILFGNGAGQPLGIFSSPALVTVAKETGQGADTVQFENLVNMYSRMWAPSRRNAVWFHNQDIEPQLFGMGLSVGVGGSTVYMPPGGLSASPYGTLFGRPMIAIEQADTLGDLGDVLFADMDQYYLIEKPMQSAMSIHVQFTTDQTVFRFVLRVDGQPVWNSALTPFGGGSTLSPFVTLAERA